MLTIPSARRALHATTITALLSLTLLTAPSLPGVGRTTPGQATTTAAERPPLTTAPDPVHRYAPPPLHAAAAALFDATAGRWLLLANADTPLPPASTTKIMTALVVLGRGNLEREAIVPPEAAALGAETGSTMGLAAGERLSLHALLYGLLLPSGNDAAATLATALAGSPSAFASLMNAEAAHLGLAQTHFVNPEGLDAPGQVTSARDLVLLANAAMHNALFRQIVATRSIVIAATAQHDRHALTNINWFIRWYPGADGVKPGSTATAGLCQVLSVRRHGRHLIAALLDTPDLHTDARDLLNYGFGEMSWTPSGQSGDEAAMTVAAGSATDPALYFPRTGHRLRAGFLDYWRRHGAALALGLPLSDEFTENGVTVQYFQNTELWWDEAAQAVIAAALGAAAVPSAALLRPQSVSAGAPVGRYCPLTGQTIAAALLSLYDAGGGVATFGYPLTALRERDGVQIQYFTTAVFLVSPRGRVWLAPLGVEALRRHGYRP